MILGVSSALRSCKLLNLKISDFTFHMDLLKVGVQNTKNHVNRLITIDGKLLQIETCAPPIAPTQDSF